MQSCLQGDTHGQGRGESHEQYLRKHVFEANELKMVGKLSV